MNGFRTVKCPTCSKPVEWNEKSAWRPFCSERCKLIDLGEWAEENHRIAGEQVSPWEGSDEPKLN